MQKQGTGGLPKIKRARGYRVYGTDGARYIDFYLNGGRALTGHRPPGTLQVLKSGGERGLWAEYPGPWRRHADRLLMQLFPEVEQVFYFQNIESALVSAGRALGAEAVLADTPFKFHTEELSKAVAKEWPKIVDGGRLKDKHKAQKQQIVYCRPWALTPEEHNRLSEGKYGPFFIPLVPFPGNILPVPLCKIKEPAVTGKEPLSRPPGPLEISETIETEAQSVHSEQSEPSPVMFQLLIKCIAGLQKLQQQDFARLWQKFDLPGIERIGPYLRFQMKSKEYAGFFTALLERGVLVPPKQSIPAVVPCEFTEGEVMPLIKECKERAWKR